MPLPLSEPAKSRCTAVICTASLRHNAQVCQRIAGPQSEIMAIVKADAYGHGLEQVVSALSRDVDWFGVANLREAKRVRLANANENRILILSPALPSERQPIVSGRFSTSVSTAAEIESYNEIAASIGEIAKLHLVVDTGMGRMGALPSEFPALLKQILAAESCELEGVASHFPSADEDAEFTASQIEDFSRIVKSANLPTGTHVHISNSAGLIGFSNKTLFTNVIRPGLALYGVSPLADQPMKLKPALSWQTRVSLVRDLPAGQSISYGRTFVTERPARVATLAVGYGDGYPRHLSGSEAEVLIGGARCPLLGRVTMDQIVVDVTHVDSVASGDEVVLLGNQGEEKITAAELAKKAGTIPWEVFTGITARVERIYA